MDFQSFYEKYAPAVRRFALFLCGDRALADDITSETFLRVWLTRGRIRELTVKSYLFAVARNAYRDLQRQGWRSEALNERGLDPAASAHELSAELESARTLQQVLIPNEIASIPGFEIQCVYKPAGYVGGDFFQIIPRAAVRVCIGQ